MDPISQGVLGAALPQALGRREKLKTITWIGCLAGLAPDLDVLIQSPSDPILFLEYHRQFTHSLAFIPVGALLCALAFHRFARHQLTFRQVYLVCLLGYATHGLLDACTTYGTQLLWPFSDERIAWNNISIIDPLFTLPLLVLVSLTLWRRNPWFARAAIVWAVSYLMLGVLQRDRAETLGAQLAESRGHVPTRISAKPGFANLLIWKVVYEADDYFYVDGVRLGLMPRHIAGDHIARLNIPRDLPWLNPDSQQARDLQRFDWFSMGYLAIDPQDPDYVVDIRYSMLPHEINALWGIRLNPLADAGDYVKYVTNRALAPGAAQARLDDLTKLIIGDSIDE